MAIRASSRVVDAEFNATSGRRLQNVIVLSNNASGLALLRTVDYEALAMLSVSATQELARQLAAAQAQLHQQATLTTQTEASLKNVEQRPRLLECADQQGTRVVAWRQ